MAVKYFWDYKKALTSPFANLFNLGMQYPGIICGFDEISSYVGTTITLGHSNTGLTIRDKDGNPEGPLGMMMNDQGILLQFDAAIDITVSLNNTSEPIQKELRLDLDYTTGVMSHSFNTNLGNGITVGYLVQAANQADHSNTRFIPNNPREKWLKDLDDNNYDSITTGSSQFQADYGGLLRIKEGRDSLIIHGSIVKNSGNVAKEDYMFYWDTVRGFELQALLTSVQDRYLQMLISNTGTKDTRFVRMVVDWEDDTFPGRLKFYMDEIGSTDPSFTSHLVNWVIPY